MAVMAAQRCIQSHREGKWFSLEHPKNSIARQMDSWKALGSLEGVTATPYHSCMFHPSERRKSQVLIHNIPGLSYHMRRICENERTCSRTERPRKNWKPKVVGGRVVSFATGEEREYPSGFCRAYAEGLKELMGDPNNTFVEIFSGPNAPLSQAVAAAVGEIVDPADGSLIPDQGTIIEYSQSHTIPTESGEFSLIPSSVEKKSNRRDAVSSGTQPSYGKREQLIPDGVNDSIEHLRQAKLLEHPFDALSSLKPDHRESLHKICCNPEALLQHREAALKISEQKLRQQRWSRYTGTDMLRGQLKLLAPRSRQS